MGILCCPFKVDFNFNPSLIMAFRCSPLAIQVTFLSASHRKAAIFPPTPPVPTTRYSNPCFCVLPHSEQGLLLFAFSIFPFLFCRYYHSLAFYCKCYKSMDY